MEEAVGTEIAGGVEIVEAVVVRVAVAQVERPSAGFHANFFGDIRECPVPVVMKYRDASAVIRRLKALREKSRRFRIEDINGLKVRPDEQVHVTIAVVVERHRGNGVHISVEARLLRHILKLAAAHVLEQLVVTEAND